jgi:hypothetical protein
MNWPNLELNSFTAGSRKPAKVYVQVALPARGACAGAMRMLRTVGVHSDHPPIPTAVLRVQHDRALGSIFSFRDAVEESCQSGSPARRSNEVDCFCKSWRPTINQGSNPKPKRMFTVFVSGFKSMRRPFPP